MFQVSREQELLPHAGKGFFTSCILVIHSAIVAVEAGGDFAPLRLHLSREKALSPPDQNDLSSFKRLRDELSQVVAKEKAKTLGASREDLVQTTRGGKAVWTTKQALAASLDQRRATVQKQAAIQRALRGGENSLWGDIAHCLETIDCYTRQLVELKAMDAMGRADIRNTCNAISKRVLKLIDELTEIEEKIEAFKERDPVLRSMDMVVNEIAVAQSNGDLEHARNLATQYAADLQRYQNWRKSLAPDLESAMHCRVDMLQQQRKTYRLRGDLGCQLGSEMIALLGSEAEEGLVDGTTVAKVAELFTSNATTWKAKNTSSPNAASRGRDVRVLSDSLGKEIGDLGRILENIERCLATFIAIQEKVGPLEKGPGSDEEDDEGSSGPRMAFTTRRT